ncbi:protein of unknown function [Methylococcus capsulatus]|jgi:hypothetical protein|uniref:Uncharacterized protein n=1 Tax=Methylococcus capsulatus TaxID=414 RepID=A0AA35XZF0_METCP|nr:protein of unknown function [Methylococcus capsulatus]
MKVARSLLGDHAPTRLEGMMPIGVYLMFGIGFIHASSP